MAKLGKGKAENNITSFVFEGKKYFINQWSKNKFRLVDEDLNLDKFNGKQMHIMLGYLVQDNMANKEIVFKSGRKYRTCDYFRKILKLHHIKK